MAETDSKVIIVGAGPVGLTLGMDLASRGVSTLIVETRAAGEPPNVKCNHVSARSMEIFRRLGIAETIRQHGLPPDFPHDVAYRTSATGQELSRIIIPSVEGRRSGVIGPDTGWPTAEPPHRINQLFLEPILYRHAASQPHLRIIDQTQLESFVQDSRSVTARIKSLQNGSIRTIAGDYLIGCDGSRSFVRRQIGARMVGDAVVQRVQSTYIRAPKLVHLMSKPLAWGNFSMNPRRCGVVYAIDGRETWLVHNYLLDSEPDFNSVDRDASIRAILGVDEAFDYEIISKEDWIGRRLIADRFRDRRVFLCGDSAHIWVPFAGYGMNAGIADAANLAWLLAARINGWGGEAILDAYEAERMPITDQVSHFAMNHAMSVARHRREVPPNIEAAGEEGERVRREVGNKVYDLNVNQYCCAGLNFGYYYERSPLIAYDDESQPGYEMGAFTPSTVPGCRFPHFWMKDGISVYDRLGSGYTLIRGDQSIDVAPLCDASATRGIPLKVLDADLSDLDGGFKNNLLLVRPDQHVAWRGDSLPDDPNALLDLAAGWRTRTAELKKVVTG